MRGVRSFGGRVGRGLAVAGVVMLLATACEDGEQDPAAVESGATSSAPPVEEEGPWSTEMTSDNGRGAQAGAAVLEEITVAEADGYDRVVLEFSGGVPGYIAVPTDPATHDGLGTEVEIPGDQHLKVVLVGVTQESSFPVTEGTAVVPEVHDLGYFEGERGVGVGVAVPADEPLSYRVTFGEGQLLVDIAHSGHGGH
ncbi:hypothetical protein SUDANB171_03029 [Streptomyces sp. enrichment culture]|jgi:hypothetical protein|uniref:AMIN-like domain-containing (lipo)protein n=1 Tax=Streptomyces xiamenensis TaxID=408015 RepID=UPI0037D5370B